MSGRSPAPWYMARKEWTRPDLATWERARPVYDASARLVAVVPEYPGFSDPDERACLIAAAPELLEALREAASGLRTSDDIKRWRALIARIEGPR